MAVETTACFGPRESKVNDDAEADEVMETEIAGVVMRRSRAVYTIYIYSIYI